MEEKRPEFYSQCRERESRCTGGGKYEGDGFEEVGVEERRGEDGL